MIVQALFVFAGVVVTAGFGFLGTQLAARRSAEASPYDAIRLRVVDLEAKDKKRDEEVDELRQDVATLREEQATDRAYIRRTHAHLTRHGIELPFDPPPWLTPARAPRDR